MGGRIDGVSRPLWLAGWLVRYNVDGYFIMGAASLITYNGCVCVYVYLLHWKTSVYLRIS